MVDATSSTRARVLAGAGAAAGTVLIGAIIFGLAQGRNEPQQRPDTPAHKARHGLW